MQISICREDQSVMGQFSSGRQKNEEYSLRKYAAAAGAVFCAGVSLLLLLLLLKGSGDTSAPSGSSRANFALMDKFDMVIGNAVSDAVDGVFDIDKVYFLSEDAAAAPRPDAKQVGEAQSAAELSELLQDAKQRLKIENMVFSEETPIIEGSKIRYYLDDTIFSVSWKQPVGGCVYSFAEVKVGHPSQFRRFMSGGEYGSGVLYTASEMAASVNAVTASSADYYSYRPSGVTIFNGNLCRVNGDYLDVCWIDDQGDLLFSKSKSPEIKNKAAVEQFVKDNHIRFSLTFGPILCEDGVSVCPYYYPIGEPDSHYSRAALGQQEALHYVIVTANMEEGYPYTPTVPEFAQELANLGVRKAYAMDGGQTATLIANQEIVNSISYGSERLISDIIYFATAIPEQE